MQLFTLLALCMATNHFTSIKDKVKRLHDLTKMSTYYEFCGLSENTTRDQIKKVFRKLRKAAPPTYLSTEDYRTLIDNGYSLLYGMRETYDDFLSHSKYFYLDEVANYKNHFYLMLFVAVVALLFLDLFVYAIRYVRYYDKLEKRRVAKKARKTNIRKREIGLKEESLEDKILNPPTTVIQHLFRKVKKYFKR
ncbi:hypothetical protein PAEPH01_0757 [Pancytospora epiphaga]|nr:hypothetical protein PAEPH01_0757 [Pancytospora epiphaga]